MEVPDIVQQAVIKTIPKKKKCKKEKWLSEEALEIEKIKKKKAKEKSQQDFAIHQKLTIVNQLYFR